jgi:predicted phosphodiesterase
MERIALISDIHGNMPALDAVLADIEHRGISRIFCLGDLVGKGPHGDLAVDICRARCERVIKGNWDDGMGQSPNANPVVPWHQARLGPERLAYLNALPAAIDFIMSGRRVRLVHASPQGVYHRVRQTDPPDALDAMFASTPFTGFGFAPDVVGYGDIHSAYLRTYRHKMLFNVGSVGNPLDLTLACYAILEGAPGGDASTPLSITFIRLPYDIERAIREAAAEGMPDLAPYADELRTARYRGNNPS